MTINTPRRFLRLFAFIALFLICVGFASTVGGQDTDVRSQDAEDALDKVEPLLLEEFSKSDGAEFFIWMVEKADLSPAHDLITKEEKGQFVYDALRSTAERTQKGVRDHLDRQRAKYHPFYIANKILVRNGDLSLVMDLAARSEVEQVTANHEIFLQEPYVDPLQPQAAEALESNLTFIRAPEVWALGYDGAGIVLAGNDTGLEWDHPAIINQYRGWDGQSVDHNYNWWDATNTYPIAPVDVFGHGTHTTGTMVGDDGGTNQIGVAPGAQTIHCKNMDNAGSGSDATFTECFEFDLAPWDLNGLNADPSKAPDAVNNSWGYRWGGQSQFEDEIAALQAAGILIEASAGNEGAGCGTLRSPGDYAQVVTTGSINHAGGSLPGTLTASSSRGSSSLYPQDYFPDVMAPGEGIRSSTPNGNYGSWNGTSMAGPHTTALVALMWEASPRLRGDIPTTVQAINDTAVPLTGQAGNSCGGDYTNGPNNDWGFGTIDAYEAVQEARRVGQPFELDVTPTLQEVCTPDNAVYAVGVGQLDTGFSDAVSLDVFGNPSGTTKSFSLNPVIPPNSSQMTIGTTGSPAAGVYSLEIVGTAGLNIVTDTVGLTIYTQVPDSVTLVQPEDAAVGVILTPLFEWASANQAASYTLEIATDSGFGNIIYSTSTDLTSHTPSVPLESLTAYYWRVWAHNSCGVSGISTDYSFITRNQRPVLLVDDDDELPDVLPYYEETLAAMSYVFDVWDTDNSDVEPDAATLANYDIVVWFTGAEYWGYAGPGPAGELALASWLDAGGCLFISSQDYFYDHGLTSFMQNYLGVASVVNDDIQSIVTGAGSIYSGLGPYSLNYPHNNWSDVINPNVATAEVAFIGDKGSAGTSRSTATYLTTFLGFPFEAFPDVLDRQEILEIFIDACPSDPLPTVAVVDPTEGQTVADVYRVLVDADDNGALPLVELIIDGTINEDITADYDGSHYFYDWVTTDYLDGAHTLQAQATDDLSQSRSSVVVNVTVSNNSPPTASFAADCTGLTCDFDATGSTDPDNDPLTFDWDFGDTSSGNGQTPVHTYVSDGTYTVVLTVTDPGGLSDADSQQVTASEQSIHVGDLDGLKSNARRGRWNATVTITVHDQSGNPVGLVSVVGDWSNGAGGSSACTTGDLGSPAHGQCTVTKSNIKNNVPSVDFTVISLALSGYIYNQGDNISTTITIYKDPPEPPPPPPPDGGTMHVAGLTGDSASAPKGGKWNATIIVTVHGMESESHISVQGITVSGSWIAGVSGGGSCTTDSNGMCTISKLNIKSNVSGVTFRVEDLVDPLNAYLYHSPDNHNGIVTPFDPPVFSVDKPSTSLIE